MSHLVWFRNDLRINDNKALYKACHDKKVIVKAIFISTPKQWYKHYMSPRQAKFIYENLLFLQKSLSEIGIPLIYHECDDFKSSVEWLKIFCIKNKIKKIFFNYQYEINEYKRDKYLKKLLKNKVVCKIYHDNILLEPGTILNKNLEMYKIYTFFRRKFLIKLKKLNICCLNSPKIRKIGIIKIKKKISPFNYPFKEIDSDFPYGEKFALKKLKNFCYKQIKNYINEKNFPGIEGTSKLSPYLTIGVLSSRQCYNELLKKFPNFLENPKNGAFNWINELIWREFYRHLIVAYPYLSMDKPFIKWTDKIKWNKKKKDLNKWKIGETGYPIVDAAMRQLNKTGWINNRLRMISASFLTKDLLINWRFGARYFMSQLLDGDLASNNGGWQWCASTGTDSVPYFRIFNPIIQGKLFDPNGNFLRKWIPELKKVPKKYIHNPHNWLKKNKYKSIYSLPIIDHNQAIKKTLSAFKKVKKK